MDSASGARLQAGQVSRARSGSAAMLGAACHLGAGVPRDQVLALMWLTRARAARSKFADRFYVAVRDGCTAQQRLEAERRAALPLRLAEGAP